MLAKRMMNRRGLLAGILAAGFAPAAIGSGILMPVRRIIPWPGMSGGRLHIPVNTATWADATFNAAGHGVGPFRHVVLYDDRAGKLVAEYDYGASVTLMSGDSFTVDFGGAPPLLPGLDPSRVW